MMPLGGQELQGINCRPQGPRFKGYTNFPFLFWVSLLVVLLTFTSTRRDVTLSNLRVA